MDVDELNRLVEASLASNEVELAAFDSILRQADALLLRDVMHDLMVELPSTLGPIRDFLGDGDDDAEQNDIHKGNVAEVHFPVRAPRVSRAFSTSDVSSVAKHRASLLGLPEKGNEEDRSISFTGAANKSFDAPRAPRRTASKKTKKVVGHSMRPCSWKPRETCDICNKEMKSRLFRKQGLLCDDCGFKCHQKCSKKLPACKQTTSKS
ncbi:hypothetical protein PTSG_05613 [Salpingoeca rosetta]|uniref:Phorbol-ester/DAG-type domain-containing protein n=1 Tax=Salpingoeca rosetta (strain ATCC 50818 / BSB-021) TaxID=946362 RepID=F2UBQ1_SALR5|nr:uncharacterized protein PTSG_05613 [Salpingoeca rosetta]EGD73917.1 hypothetical protein PTSG_05613 [Salpingoeca rosetta]|eukprot:XP_004993480.1 hypothetical protein PTSG_05613 [Salpingoeca rosetta]